MKKNRTESNLTAKPQAKTSEKKRQILDVALQCFTENGVAGTTIDMIREASGMSVGSLYHHFGNKDKIAAAVFIQGMREFGSLLLRYLVAVEAEESNKKLELGVKAIVYANVDWIAENPVWARFVFQHRSSVAVAGAETKLSEDMQRFEQKLTTWFRPFAKQGILKPLPIELISSLISGPCHDYARHWLAGRYEAPLIEYREQFADAAWNAVKAV